MHPFPLFSLALLTSGVIGAEVNCTTRSGSSVFKNVVFNVDVNYQPDIVGRFKMLQAYGVASWIGFTMSDPNPPDPVLTSNQIRMILTAAQIQDGLKLVTGPNPPPYLQLLNEPDADFYGQPIISPQDAASALQPFFQATTTTTYISPAPAYPWTSWLTDFFSACNGCSSMFPIIAAHVYKPDANDAIALIQAIQGMYPNKKIWITELSPASSTDQGCHLDAAGVLNWMQKVVAYAESQPQIERIFWKSGEASQGLGDGGATCQVGLTNYDGSPTTLLENY